MRFGAMPVPMPVLVVMFVFEGLEVIVGREGEDSGRAVSRLGRVDVEGVERRGDAAAGEGGFARAGYC